MISVGWSAGRAPSFWAPPSVAELVNGSVLEDTLIGVGEELANDPILAPLPLHGNGGS